MQFLAGISICLHDPGTNERLPSIKGLNPLFLAVMETLSTITQLESRGFKGNHFLEPGLNMDQIRQTKQKDVNHHVPNQNSLAPFQPPGRPNLSQGFRVIYLFGTSRVINLSNPYRRAACFGLSLRTHLIHNPPVMNQKQFFNDLRLLSSRKKHTPGSYISFLGGTA